MSRNRGVLLILLLCTVIGTAWFLNEQGTTRQRPVYSNTGADTFIVNMDLGVMGTDGQLEYRIKADRMTHYPADDRFLLSHPDISLINPDGTRWHVISERGQTDRSVDRVWLLGEVDIRHTGTTAGSSLHITTSDLLVKPAEELAETENAATISADGYVVKTVGLKANFRDKTLELRSRVRGRFNDAS